MNIDYELYRIFYAVASNGNITKASEELNISQPAISKSIKNLEEALGGELFIRTKRGVILTSEGEEFYKYIKEAISYIRGAENKFTELINLETGIIKIGISTTLTKTFLLPYLEEFHKLYPKINIEIVTDVSSILFNKLKNGLIDIIILNLNKQDYGNDIEIIKCKKVQDIFVANQSFSHLFNREVSLKELNKEPLILQTKESNTRKFVDEYARENGIVFKPIIELASYSLVALFAKIGFGVGYVNKEHVKSELANKEIYEIKVKEKIPSRYIGIAISKNHVPNFSSKKLIELIVKDKK